VLLAPLLSTTPGGAAIGCATVGWALAGAGIALVWPIVASALGAANGPGRRLAAATSISYGGGLAGPALIGFVAERTSLPVALLIPAMLVLALAVVAPIALTAATRQTSTSDLFSAPTAQQSRRRCADRSTLLAVGETWIPSQQSSAQVHFNS
jgi:MFS family permease